MILVCATGSSASFSPFNLWLWGFHSVNKLISTRVNIIRPGTVPICWYAVDFSLVGSMVQSNNLGLAASCLLWLEKMLDAKQVGISLLFGGLGSTTK